MPKFIGSLLMLCVACSMCTVNAMDKWENPVLIDIGIVMACVPRRFKQFMTQVQFSDRWIPQLRLLLVSYQCEHRADRLRKIYSPVPIYYLETNATFSRASNINLLQSMVRPNACLLITDVDMVIYDSVFDNIQRYVKPGTVYFPIVWSKYSPESIKLVEQHLNRKLDPYSDHAGTWRDFGYGMFAMHKQDTSRFKLDSNFTGWGGEDKEFFWRVRKQAKVIREIEPGLMHIWHEKDCRSIVTSQEQYIPCIASKSTYMASKLGLYLMNVEANKLTKADRILIAIPTSVTNFRARARAIIDTWAAGTHLPHQIEVNFFFGNVSDSNLDKISKGFGVSADRLHSVPVSDNEYPPVLKNAAMLRTIAQEFDGFDWVLKVDDDTYVSIPGLQQLVAGISDKHPQLLGCRGFGRPWDRDKLDLTKPYCMGGPGFLISMVALLQLAPHLDACVQESDFHPDRAYIWHSDVVISKCIQSRVGLGCWEGTGLPEYEHNSVFNHHYSGRRHAPESVTSHPFKTYDEMMAYHRLRMDV